jgi:hypothetical protein
MLENVERGFIYHEPNDVRESSDDSPVYEYQLQQRLQWQRHRLPATNRQDFASRAHIRGE